MIWNIDKKWGIYIKYVWMVYNICSINYLLKCMTQLLIQAALKIKKKHN